MVLLQQFNCVAYVLENLNITDFISLHTAIICAG